MVLLEVLLLSVAVLTNLFRVLAGGRKLRLARPRFPVLFPPRGFFFGTGFFWPPWHTYM